jgi:LysM repeat protein
MKKLQLAFASCLLLATSLVSAQSSQTVLNYIATYKDIAIEEMRRTGVPASITLAQGIHETGAGKSDLVLKSNNHFGIKCKTEWKGEAVYHDDDARGECFRKYENPFDSYRDHSDFLKNRAHYASLFKLDPTDFESWAHGLKKAGYATNPKYPQILIKLIKDYNLQDYTLIALNQKAVPENVIWTSEVKPVTKEEPFVTEPSVIAAPKRNYPTGVFKINNTSVVFVSAGTSFLALAQENELGLNRLFEFNDMEPSEIASVDQLIFLQRKRKTGDKEFHIVMPGENLYTISQVEGIRMDNLMSFNLLKPGAEPATGEKLYLQTEAPSMPRLAGTGFSTTATAIISEGAFVLHVVQPKETLYAITKKYSVTQEDILKWNNLLSPDLRTGQQLRINKR